MIVPGSRYANYPVVYVTTKSTTRAVITPPAAAPVLFNYTWYQWTDGDTIQSIAAKNYGDAVKWWIIANANPEILDWGSVVSSSMIRIPVVA